MSFSVGLNYKIRLVYCFTTFKSGFINYCQHHLKVSVSQRRKRTRASSIASVKNACDQADEVGMQNIFNQ